MARRIIIDTDPGQDDAVAILLALASPEDFDVAGIVAVAGNVPLALTEKNARRIVELAGRTDVPVHAGCVRPMVRPAAHGRACARAHRARRLCAARADHAARREARRRFHRRHGDGGAGRRDHAVHAGAAHQCRHGARQAAGDRRAPRPDRHDGRRLFRGRQHHAGGRVQHLCRSAGGRRRLPQRHSADRGAARPDPPDADHGGAAPGLRRHRQPHRRSGRRPAVVLGALRPDQIRQHRRAPARSLRHRLAAQAGAVRGARDQCQHRDGRAS